MTTNATMNRPRGKSRQASKALKQARTKQSEANVRLRESLEADPSMQLSFAKNYGWDFAKQDAEESVEPYEDELRAIDKIRIAGTIDETVQERLARDTDALVARIHDVRRERREAYGFPESAPEDIRTPGELRLHISPTINAANTWARIKGRSNEGCDYSKENRAAWMHAQRLFEQYDILSPPPVPSPIGDPQYLSHLMQWCVESERLRGIVELTKRIAFHDSVVWCETGLRLYVAVRREIFKTIVDVAQLRGGAWDITFTCDVDGVPTDLRYSFANPAAVPTPVGLQCDGLRIPFENFKFENAGGRRPCIGSRAHALEQKLGCLLGRLHLVKTALKAVIDAVQKGAAQYVGTADLGPLMSVASNLPAFPFWPALSDVGSVYDEARAQDDTMIANARQALEPLFAFDYEVAPDVEKFRSISYFDPDFADIIRHAAEPDRKRKRVAKIVIDGENWYNIEHVQCYWPDALPGQKGAESERKNSER